MRLGNFLQVIAILTLAVLSAFEYRTSTERTENEIYQLRVMKSFSSRKSFANEFGPDYKNVIKQKIVEEQQQLFTHRTHLMYKVIFIIVLALVSIYHFMRYFQIDYDLEHESLPDERYDASTWFLNFLFFAIVSVWYAYFSGGEEVSLIGYILGILCATKCLWHVSKVIRILRIRKLTGIRLAEIGLASLIYFHLIGFVILYYTILLRGLPFIIETMKGGG
jgi:hypothetical protein